MKQNKESVIWKKEQWNSPQQSSKNKYIYIFLSEDSLRDLWDNIKLNNIHVIGVPDGEERKNRKKTYLKNLQWKIYLTWEKK